MMQAASVDVALAAVVVIATSPTLNAPSPVNALPACMGALLLYMTAFLPGRHDPDVHNPSFTYSRQQWLVV
jgi:hypothetical protein